MMTAQNPAEHRTTEASSGGHQWHLENYGGGPAADDLEADLVLRPAPLTSDDHQYDGCLQQQQHLDLSLEAHEYQVLQSLIPTISHRADVSEVEIVDACVEYIESLQRQLVNYLKKVCNASQGYLISDRIRLGRGFFDLAAVNGLLAVPVLGTGPEKGRMVWMYKGHCRTTRQFRRRLRRGTERLHRSR